MERNRMKYEFEVRIKLNVFCRVLLQSAQILKSIFLPSSVLFQQIFHEEQQRDPIKRELGRKGSVLVLRRNKSVGGFECFKTWILNEDTFVLSFLSGWAETEFENMNPDALYISILGFSKYFFQNALYTFLWPDSILWKKEGRTNKLEKWFYSLKENRAWNLDGLHFNMLVLELSSGRQIDMCNLIFRKCRQRLEVLERDVGSEETD